MFANLAKFGLIGIFNTLIDFALFNILSSRKVRLRRIPANLASTTVAMIFSFVMNRGFVFNSTGGNVYLQSLEFFLVTAFGLYVLQNFVIYVLLEIWEGPVNVAWRVIKLIKLDRMFSQDFIRKNSAKAAATVVSLTWNYLMFSLVVFKS